ncbi:MAG: hypothetical protein IPL61_33805 [Myxococcales bacterium]|nr:hypothetical protein [Myxococcales bacterium]
MKMAIVVGGLMALLVAAAPAHADPEVGTALVEFGAGGLRVGGVVMVKGAIGGATLDRSQDLIWFTQKKTLFVLDLRAATPRPVAIAKNMPTGAFSVSGFSGATYGADQAGVYPRLEVDKLAIDTATGPVVGHFPTIDARARKAARAIKVVGASWLKAQRARPRRETDLYWQTTRSDYYQRSEAPSGDEPCTSGELDCGATASFGLQDAIKLVVATSTCDKVGCQARCLLRLGDQRWAVPTTTAAWQTTVPSEAGPCFGFALGPHNRYVVGDARCTVAVAGVTCETDLGWTAAAWIDLPVGYARPQNEIDQVYGPLTDIDRASPRLGLPAFSEDGAKVVLPGVRQDPGQGAATTFVITDRGSVDDAWLQTLGHDADAAMNGEFTTEAWLRQRTFRPMPSWTFGTPAPRTVITDWGTFTLALTASAVTVTLTSAGTELGKQSWAIRAGTKLHRVAIAPGDPAFVYVQLDVPNGKEFDTQWVVMPLAAPVEP